MSKKAWFGVACGAAVLWVIFLVVAYKTLDPDFGWHLQTGNLLLKQGIPATDPFSYTMPSFPWVDHGRWSDMAIAIIYGWFGKLGLSIIAATLLVLTLMIAVPVYLWTWSLVPILLGTGVLMVRSGVRPQIEDWLAVVILIRLRGNVSWWRKWRRMVPVGFALWANLHGGFAVGLLVLAIDIGVSWWKKERREAKDLWVWILSLAATLVNPYGWRLWEEIWLTVSDTHLRSSIMEWMPFYTKTELGFWLLTAMVFAAIRTKFRAFRLSTLIVIAVLFFAGLSSLRNMPFYVLAVIPVLAEWLKRIYDSLGGDKIAQWRAKIFYIILTVVGVAVFAVEIGVPMWRIWVGKWIRYPEAATEYLAAKKYPGRLFTGYGWGGFVIWKIPGEKVFVDGRMPSWRWKAPAGESNWAFKDYEKVIEGNFEDEFAKYNIRTVLWNKETDLPQGRDWIEKILLSDNQVSFMFGKKLTEKGWQVVYEDEIAVIYRKDVP